METQPFIRLNSALNTVFIYFFISALQYFFFFSQLFGCVSLGIIKLYDIMYLQESRGQLAQ